MKSLVRRSLRRVRVIFFTAIGKLSIGKSGSGLFCGGFCTFSRQTVVGNNVNFNGMRIRGHGDVIIGNNFHSGTGCEILTQNHNYEGEAIPYDDTYMLESVAIGDNVWLGNRVMILPGVEIGEGAIIQAGSIVVCDIPACTIAGGHPAAVFSSRDQSRYHKLKALGKFH